MQDLRGAVLHDDLEGAEERGTRVLHPRHPTSRGVCPQTLRLLLAGSDPKAAVVAEVRAEAELLPLSPHSSRAHKAAPGLRGGDSPEVQVVGVMRSRDGGQVPWPSWSGGM